MMTQQQLTMPAAAATTAAAQVPPLAVAVVARRPQSPRQWGVTQTIVQKTRHRHGAPAWCQQARWRRRRPPAAYHPTD